MQKNSEKTDPNTGFLMYNRRPVLSEPMVESLKEAETITGISQGELRMRLVGQGIGVLNVKGNIKKLKECARGMQSIGIKAGVVDKKRIKNTILPPAARHLRVTKSSMTFLDGQKHPVFEINQDTDLLIIITDLSGKAVRQIMTAMAYTGHAIHKKFEEILKKISIFKPAVIFYDFHKSPESGVYVDSEHFSYMGLDEKLTHSKGTNFRVMINEAVSLSRSVITDENFGISLLPGANPDWRLGKQAIEKELGRYAGYILAAAEKKLLPFVPEEAEGSPEESAYPDFPGEAAAGFSSGITAAKGLQPPPDMEYSKITAFFQSSLPELIVALIVIVSPVSFFMAGVNSISAHHVFWKTLAGSTVLTAGVLMFGYSLLLFYYRRMIENTPTSKIRSLSLGMVELSGKARLFYDLRSSATKTHCVYYRCRYYKLQKTGEGSHWSLNRSVTSGKIPFFIEDDTGKVLVKPQGAIFNLPLVTQSFQGSYVPSLSLQLHDPNTKVVEEMVPVGARIYVLGSAQIEKHGRTFRDIVTEKLRQLKQSPDTMAEYDINGDGRIDGDEWEAARKDVERMVYAESLANGSGQSESVVIEKPRFGLLPFIIADSEQKLIRRLMLRTLIFFVGALITMGVSVNFLVGLFH